MKLFSRKTWGVRPSAGLFGFVFGTIRYNDGREFDRVAVHFFPSRDCWTWGYRKDWYDGPLYDFGLGPLLLISWS